MELFLVIVSLLHIAFFSGMEIAYVSSNKIFLEIEKKQNTFLAKIISKLISKPAKFLATMLVGNAIALGVFIYNFSSLLNKTSLFQNYQFNIFQSTLIKLGIISVIVIFFVELTKLVFQNYSNQIIKYLSLPAYIFFKLLNYFSSFIIWISDIILIKFFKLNPNTQQTLFSKIELENFVNEQLNSSENQGNIDTEIQIFQNALEFTALKARDIMTPRTELVAVEIHSTVNQLKEIFIQTGYSKVIIYQNSLDNILGYVHSFELFKKPRSIKAVMVPVEFVPETIFIKEVINLLTVKRKSMAVVLDEYGGTSGILTIEDIVEELFGEIDDEHDEDEELVENKMDDKTFQFSARLDVAYLNEEYSLNLPEEDAFSTLGGFIVNSHKEIPQQGEIILVNNFKFEIEKAANNKIELVKLTLID